MRGFTWRAKQGHRPGLGGMAEIVLRRDEPEQPPDEPVIAANPPTSKKKTSRVKRRLGT